MFKRSTLRLADPENVRRLARYLKLDIEGYSDRRVISLVVWRLHPNRRWYR